MCFSHAMAHVYERIVSAFSAFVELERCLGSFFGKGHFLNVGLLARRASVDNLRFKEGVLSSLINGTVAKHDDKDDDHGRTIMRALTVILTSYVCVCVCGYCPGVVIRNAFRINFSMKMGTNGRNPALTDFSQSRIPKPQSEPGFWIVLPPVLLSLR